MNERACSALWFKYEEGLDLKSVARAMKTSTSNVKVILHRARRALAEAMSDGTKEVRDPVAHDLYQRTLKERSIS